MKVVLLTLISISCACAELVGPPTPVVIDPVVVTGSIPAIVIIPTNTLSTTGTMPLASPAIVTGTMPLASPAIVTGTMPLASPAIVTGTTQVTHYSISAVQVDVAAWSKLTEFLGTASPDFGGDQFDAAKVELKQGIYKDGYTSAHLMEAMILWGRFKSTKAPDPTKAQKAVNALLNQ